MGLQMKVKILCFANPSTGWGHWYRSIALAEYIQDQGHQVTIISDRRPPGQFRHHRVAYDDPTMWLSPLLDSFDWLIIDLPDEAPGWLYDHCQERGIKTCILNGVGHQVGDRATLRIVQGLGEGQYSGVDYIILRDSVFQAKKVRNPIVEWFVFGGASDKMCLTQKFPNWQRMVFTISDEDWQAADNHDNGFLLAASQCKKACIQMGMTAWELAVVGVPAYVFAPTPMHLNFALEMEAAGYIRAYPIGGNLPRRSDMISFLEEPFQITGKPIDGRACERILGLMNES